MTPESRSESEPLLPSLAQRIDQAADRLEAARRAGERPQIEDFVRGERTTATSFKQRWRRGERRRGARKAWPRPRRGRRRSGEELIAWRSAVRWWRTVFFCSRGGEYLYRFSRKKRQELRRGHIVVLPEGQFN